MCACIFECVSIQHQSPLSVCQNVIEKYEWIQIKASEKAITWNSMKLDTKCQVVAKYVVPQWIHANKSAKKALHNIYSHTHTISAIHLMICGEWSHDTFVYIFNHIRIQISISSVNKY